MKTQTLYVTVALLILSLSVTNLVLIVQIRGAIIQPEPPPLWDADEWARKAIVFDGYDRIDQAGIALYKDAMTAAAHRCLEGPAVLDQLIERSLLHDSLVSDGERLRILNQFSRLSGVHDCSEILSRN